MNTVSRTLLKVLFVFQFFDVSYRSILRLLRPCECSNFEIITSEIRIENKTSATVSIKYPKHFFQSVSINHNDLFTLRKKKKYFPFKSSVLDWRKNLTKPI